jgi:hypothetical protein
MLTGGVMIKINLEEAIPRWTKKAFILRSSYYTGRNPSEGDLNSVMLEGIYNGIKKEVGQKEATNFVKFVENLTDLSASAFIQAFERFWRSDCTNFNQIQPEGSGNQLTGQGDQLLTEGFGVLANALSGRRVSPETIRLDSRRIKAPFIAKYKAQLG